ncbi:hypothetical protein WG922_01185 [Ramlibacter sp. AN1015]|uniref:hypothetical protein n=1 Tax=Ramlibacter sp. AN1015 TaxID=3133428 RepID=UPI0030BB2992
MSPNISHPAGQGTSPLRDATIVTGIVVNVLLYAYALWIARSGAAGLDRLLVEDRLVEWLQFLGFTALAGLLALVAVHLWRRRVGLGLDALVLAGGAAVVALAALEEISWFQRVLQVETPEFFRNNNRQGETNLHNLALGSSSVNKSVLVKLIFLVGITHNLVLPLLARRMPRVRSFVESWGLYLPPLWPAVTYLVLVALSQLTIGHGRVGELGEAFGAVHYLTTAFAAYALGVGRGGEPLFTTAVDRRRASALFSGFIVLLVFFAWLLAAGYAGRPLTPG